MLPVFEILHNTEIGRLAARPGAGLPILDGMASLDRCRGAGALRLLACVCLVALAGCGAAPGQTCADSASARCVRVLFLGNSYTYVNDLPGTFAQLAQAGGHPVQVAMVANGAETLAEHAGSTESTSKISSQSWSFVVLQEQSETPASSAGASYYMYPAARQLASRARAAGATPLFFMTPAHRDGLPGSATPDYESMQRAVDDSYLVIARELGAPVAPVGYAWFVVRREHPETVLWQDDGSHPSVAGTYLAACVFYATVLRQSPEGLAFEDGLPDSQARALQSEAAANVLNLAEKWGLR
jgi:hypothetical protein